MSVTPLHPLSSKANLTAVEWLIWLRYEGLIGVREDDPALPMLRDMEALGLVDIAPLHGYLGVCPTGGERNAC